MLAYYTSDSHLCPEHPHVVIQIKVNCMTQKIECGSPALVSVFKHLNPPTFVFLTTRFDQGVWCLKDTRGLDQYIHVRTPDLSRPHRQ